MGYSLVAVDFLPPPAVNATLSRLAGDLASGALRPLPHVVHDLAAVRAALRQMSQARHVGKIVVRARTLQQQQGVDKVGLLLLPRAFQTQTTNLTSPCPSVTLCLNGRVSNPLILCWAVWFAGHRGGDWRPGHDWLPGCLLAGPAAGAACRAAGPQRPPRRRLWRRGAAGSAGRRQRCRLPHAALRRCKRRGGCGGGGGSHPGAQAAGCCPLWRRAGRCHHSQPDTGRHPGSICSQGQQRPAVAAASGPAGLCHAPHILLGGGPAGLSRTGQLQRGQRGTGCHGAELAGSGGQCVVLQLRAICAEKIAHVAGPLSNSNPLLLSPCRAWLD